MDSSTLEKERIEKATFGAGCFWCVEAVFQNLQGVKSVVSGYAGGKTIDPTYKQVCSGTTGHAEVCRIEYNAKVISFEQLLDVFWKIHDPTTLNRQGNDIGTQYRSVIFYESEDQKIIAENKKQKLDNSNTFNQPIVTEIARLEKFYTAEEDHQNYFNLHRSQPYCAFNIKPKVDKIRSEMRDLTAE